MISRRSPSPPKPSVVTRGLIEWFDFADGKGTETILKSRVSDNVLTLSGFNFDENSGWTGKGLRFDGVNDVGVLPHRVGFECEEMTLEMRFSSLGGRANFKKGANSGEGTSFGILESGGLLYGWIIDGGPKTPPSETRPKPTSEDSISLVISKSKSTVFVNGKEIWSTPLTKDIIALEKSSFTVGLHGGKTYCKSDVYSTKIYNVALTPEEIAQNYEYEQSIDRTTASTYPALQEQKSYGIGLSTQLSDEQKSTFRLSLDGTKFVAGLRYCEWLEVEEFTYSEIQVEMEKEEWSKIEELE